MRRRNITAVLYPTVISLVVSGALLFFVFSHKDSFDETLRLLSGARLDLLVYAVLIGPVVQFLRAWRFQRFLFARKPWPDFPMIRIATNLNFFNYLLPFRIGEASFPLMLKRNYGTELKVGTAALVFVRLADLAVVVGLAGVALTGFGTADLLLVGGGCIALSLVVLFLLLIVPPDSGSRLLSGAKSEKLKYWIDGIVNGFTLVSRSGDRIGFVAVSVAIWLCQFAICYLCLCAVAAGAGYLQGVVAGAAAILSFSLPVNGVAGIGPVQAAWAYAFQYVGGAFDIGVTSSIVFSGVTIVSISLQTVIVAVLALFLKK